MTVDYRTVINIHKSSTLLLSNHDDRFNSI